MNVLIDTNIVIPLEDTGQVLDPRMAEMRNLSQQNGYALCVHPSQKRDIARDNHERRREILASRLRQYPEIPSPPELTETDIERYGWSQQNENDQIDNLLLLAVFRRAVHFLVTNDNQIHAKARKVGIQENVHYLEQFIAYLRTQATEKAPPPPGIEEIFLHQIGVEQPFFDSLRSDYDGFNNWYRDKALDRRKAWCVREKETVYAICIYKREQSPVITDSGRRLTGEALKLCTFKVGEEVRGRKLGERLLYCAFRYAAMENIPHIYTHIFGEQHEMLVSLCEDYGFQVAGRYKSRDETYLKEMSPPESSDCEHDPLTYAVKYYPNYLDHCAVAKFIVPIRPQYHDDLFADTSFIAESLYAHDSSQYSSESNTIKKAYICHSNTTQIRRGDLLLFYRTRDRKNIECVGVVEQTYRGKDINRVLPMVSKRTVYTKNEIEQWLRRETLIILFRFLRNFHPVSREMLYRADIKGQIQTIRKISHEQYTRCFRRET